MLEKEPINTDERLRILKLIEDGRVTASEGAELLNTLGRGSQNQNNASGVNAGDMGWFRVKVTDLVTGRRKTTVNIPMGLVGWGLKIGAQFSPEVKDIDMDDIAQVLRSGVNGKIIDVVDEEDGEHVEIFIE